MEPRRGIWYLLVVFAAIIGVALLLRPVLFVIVAAAVYAFITWPLSSALAKHMPRAGAVVVVNIGIALIVIGVLFVVGPAVYAQAHSLITELPAAFASVTATLPAGVRETAAAPFRLEAATIALWSREAMQAGIGLARSVVGIVAAAIIVPVLGAYLQADYPRYERAVIGMVSKQRQPALTQLLHELSGVAGAFIRAQLIVSAIVGFLIYAALLVARVPFAPVIGLATAITDLVPYLGGLVAFVPSILLALATGGIAKATLAAILILTVFGAEAHFLQPQIVGVRTHLPPSAIVISLLVGGTLFGVMGLYLAVPFAASLPTLYRFFCGDRSDECLPLRSSALEKAQL
jgi:predicted PurR-regulated permease PerM